MEFSVLGPLRVEDGDTMFALGGPKQRTLLALLVASVGIPVSTDALLAGMYGPDAAPGLRRSLATYVSVLRRSLGEVIQRRGDGYVLDADPSSVDAVRFESAVQRARTMTDHNISRDLLRSALALWRGAAYADVDAATRLSPEIWRLEALRAEAYEARIELDLRAGRHRELIAELETLVHEHPLREQLRAQQMLALYRSGRQADALHAYRRAAELLREELGLEPSPFLRNLELRILSQDRDLDYRPRPQPRPLPARYSSFLGRERELEEVRMAMEEHRLVTVTGPGGIGKSSLAVEAARTLAEAMTVAYVPVERRRDTALVRLLAESLGVFDGGQMDLLDRVVRTLGDERHLLLLDGCEHVIDELPYVVEDILRRCPETVVLVTSREAMFIPGEELLRLGPMDVGAHSAANALFAERARLSLDDPTTAAQVTTIGERVSGMPLALELAAARSRRMPLEQILASLDDQVTLLKVTRSADARNASVAASLDLSYQSMPGELQRTFRRLGVFHSNIPIEGAQAVADVEPIHDHLRGLVDLSLLDHGSREGTYALLEPVRQFAAMKLEDAGEEHDARLRHARWTVDRWRERNLAFERDIDRGYHEMVRRDGSEAAAVAAWAVDHDEPDITLAIVASTARVWSRFQDPVLLGEPALRALDHSRASKDGVYRRALARTAWLYRLVDRDLARDLLRRLEEALEPSDDLETRRAVAEIRAVLPQVLDNLWLEHDAMERSLHLFDGFLELTQQLGWPREPHLYNRSILLDAVGRHEDAESDIRVLLEWAEATGSEEDRAGALHALAGRDFLRGDFDSAVHKTREASRSAAERGDIGSALESERQAIWTLTLAGRVEEAAATIERYDELAEVVGSPLSHDLNPKLGARVAAEMGQWDHFVDLAGRSIDWAESARTTPSQWQAYLKGSPIFPADVVYLTYPVLQWLMHEDRTDEAVRILAAMPMALSATAFDSYNEIGESERLERLADSLNLGDATDPPASLEDLFTTIALLFRPDFA